MTPKEKAKELIDKYMNNEELLFEWDTQAKQCVLIAVDEIIDTLKNLWGGTKESAYWESVKQEIEKL